MDIKLNRPQPELVTDIEDVVVGCPYLITDTDDILVKLHNDRVLVISTETDIPCIDYPNIRDYARSIDFAVTDIAFICITIDSITYSLD